MFAVVLFGFAGEICHGDSLVGRIYTDGDRSLRFSEVSFELEAWNRETNDISSREYPYREVYAHGVRFIEYGENYGRTWLALYNDRLMLLYDRDHKRPYFFGVTTGARSVELYRSPDGLEASSHLVEGTTVYDAAHLEDGVLGRPWVEGVAGVGLGQWLQFERLPQETAIVWYGGFTSYAKPHLFRQNARPRRIRVSGNDRWRTVSLPDSPDPVHVHVPDELGALIRITIEAVYRGTRWEDTCVAMLMVTAE